MTHNDSGVCVAALVTMLICTDGWRILAANNLPITFQETPPSAIIYAVPEFIWGMSVQTCCVGKIVDIAAKTISPDRLGDVQPI
jgi:hypothetical protein